MLEPVKLDRSYGPKTIAVMRTAFDKVCQSFGPRIRDNEDVRRTLALAILRLADQGERDPMLLAEGALRQLTGPTVRHSRPARGAANGSLPAARDGAETAPLDLVLSG